MRELRVEDALLYLDQVKIEFQDRPQIYNEFLDIMKTFKTQQIDTPGVIRRVSTLFQGNQRLVLGFNTFLPEGYKIEIPNDGDGPPVAVYRVPGQPGVTHILGPAPEPSGPPAGPAPAGAAAGKPPSAVAQQQPQQGAARPPQQQQMHPSQRPGGPQQHAQAQHGPPTHQHQPPQSQHQQPFKSQQQQQGPAGMGPSGPSGAGGMVVDQSSTGAGSGSQYQQHLPSAQSQQQAMQIHQAQQRGQQQSQMSVDQQGRRNGQEPQPPRPAQHHQQPGGMAGQQPVGLDGKVGSAPNRMGTGAQQAPPPGAPHPGVMQHPRAHPAHAPQQPQPPVEFDHAINYVTTIKKRFSAEPETYKKFLEILHTYQKEQRGIKDVLDEVSVLFADHPDLLKEFTYFLPDAVQAQAKAQLDQAAKESEMRMRAASSKQAIMQTARGMQRQAHGLPPVHAQPPLAAPAASGGMSGPGGVYALAPAPIPFGATQGRSDEREREICRTAVYGAVSFSPVRPPRRAELTVSQAAVKNGRPTMIPVQPLQPSTAESAFFERAKLHLNRKELAPDKPPGSRRHTPYTEFLKCLHLYGAGILNKEELFLLLRGLFMQGHAPKSGANAGGGATNPTVASDAQELLREFEEIMVGRGPYANQETMLKDKSKYGSLSSWDFDSSNCERPTPSYRKYPSDYPHNLFFSHSGQTEADAAVLNSPLISVPERSSKQRGTNSPEDYDGVRARRNVYEEAMFRVEDERFEVDMAIERNVMAMRQVEAIAEEVTQLRENEEKDGQPIGRMRYKLRSRTLNCAQINAIARLYADKGDEVIQHLMRNPVAVLPIAYQRLREKDTAWRKAKADMTKHWKSTCEENFEGSLDVLCYFYRKEIERSFLPEQLLNECKQAELFSSRDETQPEHSATLPFQPEFLLSSPNEGAFLFQPHLRLHLPGGMVHKNAFQCIVLQALHGASVSTVDRERVGRIWAEFMVPWFDYPVHWVLSELRESLKLDKNSSVVKYAPGQLVRTAYGDGRIVSISDGNQATGVRYKVTLPYGIGHVSPSAIIHSLPTTDGPRYVRTGGQMKSIERAEDAVEECRKLPSTCGLLFGTEAVYVFLRLYSLLVSILSDTREHLMEIQSPKLHSPSIANHEEGTTAMDVEKAEEQVKKASLPSESTDSSVTQIKYNYPGVIGSLQKLLAHDIDHKTYENYCRKTTKEKVHELAAVPKLVRSCTDALLKVAKEDLLLNLFDWSQLKGQDPWQLRPRCLKVSDDACYRIQFDSLDRYMSFAYVPSDDALLTSPQEASMEDEGGLASGTPMDEGDGDNNMEIDDPDGDVHVAKRPKLE